MGTVVNVIQPVNRVWVELACGHHSETSFQRDGSGATMYHVHREVRCERCSQIVVAALAQRFVNEGDRPIPVDINEPSSAISCCSTWNRREAIG